MIHTIFTFINIILALGFIVFLGFLYTMVKKESGQWTALLIIIIALGFIKWGTPDPEKDDHQKEITLYDSPVITSNRQLQFETKLGGLITIHHSLELHVPTDKNAPSIRIIKQDSFVSGWMPGFKYKVQNIKLEQTDDNKIKYTVPVYATSLILGLLNYSDLQTFVGEK